MTLPCTINEKLKWPTKLPILIKSYSGGDSVELDIYRLPLPSDIYLLAFRSPSLYHESGTERTALDMGSLSPPINVVLYTSWDFGLRLYITKVTQDL